MNDAAPDASVEMNVASPDGVRIAYDVAGSGPPIVVGLSAAPYTTTGRWRVAAVSAVVRPVTDPLVMAGPLFQPIRDIVFALAFYPIGSVVFARPYGWLVL